MLQGISLSVRCQAAQTTGGQVANAPTAPPANGNALPHARRAQATGPKFVAGHQAQTQTRYGYLPASAAIEEAVCQTPGVSCRYFQESFGGCQTGLPPARRCW